MNVCLVGVRQHQSGDVGMKDYAFTTCSACYARYVAMLVRHSFCGRCQ